MKFLVASDYIKSILGPYHASGGEAQVWFLNEKYVLKLIQVPFDAWKTMRELAMSRESDVPIAKIFDMRVIGRTGICVVGLMIQERLKMKTRDIPLGTRTLTVREGHVKPPPRVFVASGVSWVQRDTHEGNHAEGRWIDIGCVDRWRHEPFDKNSRIAA